MKVIIKRAVDVNSFWGHHGSAGVVVGNTIQVRLGAHIFPLVAFWLKREIGSR